MKLIGYAPDIDPATEGALVEIENIIPTIDGMKGAPSAVAESDALSAAANSLAVIEKLDGTRRVFAGLDASIQELSGSSWTDRSAGGGYSVITESRWSFAQFGDTTIAANKDETTQASTSGAFAAIAGAPKATACAVSEGFIMLVDVNDGVNDNQDGWHCCAYLDHTDWTESVTTQSASGRLVTKPGPLKAVREMSDGFVAYKDKAIFVGSYIGAPDIFQWQAIPGDVGVSSQSVIVLVDSFHYFIGPSDIYRFDGARPEPIGHPIRDWFFSDYDQAKDHRTIGSYNQSTGNIWWHYCSRSNSGTTPDKAIIYNVRSGKWGKVTISVEAASNYYAQGLTYESIGTAYSTYEDIPAIPYNSPFWSSGAEDISVIKTDHKVYTLSGVSTSSSITLPNVGDSTYFTTETRVKPRFVTEPDTSTLEYSYDYLHGDAFTALSTTTYQDGRYDLTNSSRWHRNKLNFTGDVEIVEVIIDLVPDGEE